MYEQWKVRQSFVDDVNIITKLFLGDYTIFFIIFVHNFDFMLYITILMLVFLLMFNGTQFKKITAIFITISNGFALLSSCS